MPVDHLSAASQRRPWWRSGVGVAVLVGAVWRLGVLVVDKWHQPLLLNDSLYYSGQAKQLARGVWFRELFVDQPGAEHGPLTSILMAPLSWMEHPVPWQRLVTIACGIASIVVLALVARRLAGDRAGVVAAWIAALYPNLWMNDGLVMAESVSTVLIAVGFLAALRWLDVPSVGRAVALGAVVGLATLARSELALAVVLTAAWCWWLRGRSGWRVFVQVGAAAAVVVAPWVLFNLARFEQPVLLTTNDGTTLRGVYCDNAFAGPDLGNWSLLCIAEPAGVLSDEDPSVRSARLRDEAFAYARDNVERLPVVVAARLARGLDLFRLDRLVAQDVGEERYRWASWAGIVCWWLLAPLAVIGLRRLAPPPRVLLVIPVVVVFVTTVAFYGAHRIRSPLEPTVVLGAAVAVAAWLSRRRTKSSSDVVSA